MKPSLHVPRRKYSPLIGYHQYRFSGSGLDVCQKIKKSMKGGSLNTLYSKKQNIFRFRDSQQPPKISGGAVTSLLVNCFRYIMSENILFKSTIDEESIQSVPVQGKKVVCNCNWNIIDYSTLNPAKVEIGVLGAHAAGFSLDFLICSVCTWKCFGNVNGARSIRCL